MPGVPGLHPSERAGSPEQPAWVVRLYWNPWARLIFLGPLIMALGGVLSLLDRRLRVGAGTRKKSAEVKA